MQQQQQQHFSSAIVLQDLNDFISPTQECIKPVVMTPSAPSLPVPSGGVARRGIIDFEAAVSYDYVNGNGDSEQQGHAQAQLLQLQRRQQSQPHLQPQLLQPQKLEKAKITLSDCLACSGCITSAEAVLVQFQSHTQFWKVLDEEGRFINKNSSFSLSTDEPASSLPNASGYESGSERVKDLNLHDLPMDLDVPTTTSTSTTTPLMQSLNVENTIISIPQQQQYPSLIPEREKERKVICVSISSQSRASLGAKYGLDAQEVWNALNILFLQRLGIDYLIDVDFARDICLLEGGREFLSRLDLFRQKSGGVGEIGGKGKGEHLPMLASSCPGWICYVEKTHPTILPLLDSTKSPQQVTGSLLKSHLAQKLGISPKQVYHVSIMPCYDKKLEASRPDFDLGEEGGGREVDLVLATGEVEEILLEGGWRLEELGRGPSLPLVTPSLYMKSKDGFHISRTEGSSSGGYLSHILRQAVLTLYGISLSARDVEEGTNGVTLHPGRNSDYLEVNYTPPGGSIPVLRFAYVYGFRNIQNLVRKVKTSTAGKGRRAGSSRKVVSQGGGEEEDGLLYHFVEVMACPSGCINGGGQARPSVISADVSMGGKEEEGVVVPKGALPLKEWISKAEGVYRDVKFQSLEAPFLEDFVEGDRVEGDNTTYKEGVVKLLREWIGTDEERRKILLHTKFHAVAETLALQQQSGLAVKW